MKGTLDLVEPTLEEPLPRSIGWEQAVQLLLTTQSRFLLAIQSQVGQANHLINSLIKPSFTVALHYQNHSLSKNVYKMLVCKTLGHFYFSMGFQFPPSS